MSDRYSGSIDLSPPTVIQMSDDDRNRIRFGDKLPADWWSGKSYLLDALSWSMSGKDHSTGFSRDADAEAIAQRWESYVKTAQGITNGPNVGLKEADQFWKMWLEKEKYKQGKLAEGPERAEHPAPDVASMVPMPVEPPAKASLSNMDPNRRNMVLGRALGALLSGDPDWAQWVLEPLKDDDAERQRKAAFDQASRQAQAQRAQVEYRFLTEKIDRANDVSLKKWQRELAAVDSDMSALLEVRKKLEGEGAQTQKLIADSFGMDSPDLRSAYLDVLVAQGRVSPELAQAIRPALLKPTNKEIEAKERIATNRMMAESAVRNSMTGAGNLAARIAEREQRDRQFNENLSLDRAKLEWDKEKSMIGFEIDGRRLTMQEGLANASIAKTLAETDLLEWAQTKFGLEASVGVLESLASEARLASDSYQKQVENLMAVLAQIDDDQPELRKTVAAQLETAKKQRDQAAKVAENARNGLDKKVLPMLPGGVVRNPGQPVWEQSLRGPIGGQKK